MRPHILIINPAVRAQGKVHVFAANPLVADVYWAYPARRGCILALEIIRIRMHISITQTRSQISLLYVSLANTRLLELVRVRIPRLVFVKGQVPRTCS